MTARPAPSPPTGQPPLPAPGTPAWYQRIRALPRGRFEVRCLLDDAHPDGEVVPKPGDTSGLFELWRAELDASDRLRLTVNPLSVPDATPLWFVHLPDRNANPPRVTLVGYATAHLAPGSVVNDPEFFHLPVRNDEQVGAVRWWPDTATVDQVYVAKQWRGLDQGRLLIYAASAFHQHHGWPGRLHLDGNRTRAGEEALSARRHPQRITPLARLYDDLDRPDGPQPPPDPQPNT